MKTSRTSIYLHSVLYSFSSFFSFNKANSLLLGLVDFVDSIRSTVSSCTILTRRKATPYQNATRHEPTVQVWLALLRYPRDVTTLQVINSLTRTLSLSSPRQLQLLPSASYRMFVNVTICRFVSLVNSFPLAISSQLSLPALENGNYTVKNRRWRLPRRALSLPIIFPSRILLSLPSRSFFF